MILPHAQLKIYLTASVEVRAQTPLSKSIRRKDRMTQTLAEIEEGYQKTGIIGICTGMISPLRQAEDAVLRGFIRDDD